MGLSNIFLVLSRVPHRNKAEAMASFFIIIKKPTTQQQYHVFD